MSRLGGTTMSEFTDSVEQENAVQVNITNINTLADKISHFTTLVEALAETDPLRVFTGAVAQIGDRRNALFDIISGTGTANGKDILAHDTLAISFKLQFSNEIFTSTLGSSAGVDAAPYVRRAQEMLGTVGGGKIIIDINGASQFVDGLTVDPSYADYAVDVQSGIEITAIPEFKIIGDKTQGGIIGGYCLFHIFEDKKDIKIHGFKDIAGGDRTTDRGIGQIVAIRGATGITRATNIDIWDITCKEIRDEPFRLGQTVVAGHISENVNIWDVRVDGCTSHGVVFRSTRNSHASGLNIKNADRLGIDISSWCTNTHLNGGKGSNTFFNTVGGAKCDGSANNIDCSIGDYTYDGNVDGAGSINGFAFRLMGKRARAHNIYAVNCGGSGFNMLSGGVADNDMDMNLEDIEIDTVTNGDGSSSTFNGKPLFIKHDSVGDLGVKMKNVQISNAVAVGQIDANKVRGDLKLVNNSVFTFNNNVAGQSKDLCLHLSLVDSIYNVVKDGTNGGSDNVNIFIHEFEGNSELDIENSTKAVVAGDAFINSTRTRQIRFDNCPDFHISDLTGAGTSMVWIAGTMTHGIAAGLTGAYTDGLIFESGGTTYTANKGLYADCINSGVGGYVISSTATQDNLL